MSAPILLPEKLSVLPIRVLKSVLLFIGWIPTIFSIFVEIRFFAVDLITSKSS